MKTIPSTHCLVLAAVLAGASASAQSSNGVPGPQDYPAFSQFIADRNIFDPSRQPHFYSGHSTYHPHPHPKGTPGIQLVGTMSYDKGMFAFFNGNSDDLSSVLQAGGTLQGYTVTEITPDFVTLETAGQKDVHKMKVGDGLRQENGKWIFADASDLPMDSASSSPISSSSSSTTGETNSAPSAPTSAGEPNDILKRLMQQREKENQ